MMPAWIRVLRCPDDRSSELRLIEPPSPPDGELEDGRLECPTCGRVFSLAGGIPSLLPADSAATVGSPDEDGDAPSAADRAIAVERGARDEESQLYDRLYDDRAYRFELETYVLQLDARPGERVLDVGCGTGRVTKEYLDRPGQVVAADHSLASLRQFRTRMSDVSAERLVLVHCDARRLPFPSAYFDAAVATSLFSNLPTAETRDAALREIRRVLRPGGRLLVTVYNHCWSKRVRQWLGLSRSGAKQGFHSGGRIPYYNFDPAEFRDWVGSSFEAGPCFGLNHRVPGLSSRSHRLAHRLDRLLYRTPLSLRVFAKEMGLVARKPRVGGASGS